MFLQYCWGSSKLFLSDEPPLVFSLPQEHTLFNMAEISYATITQNLLVATSANMHFCFINKAVIDVLKIVGKVEHQEQLLSLSCGMIDRWRKLSFAKINKQFSKARENENSN